MNPSRVEDTGAPRPTGEEMMHVHRRPIMAPHD
jgi:hypothetical protein